MKKETFQHVPLDSRFRIRVISLVKVSTIRKKPWIVGKRYAFFTWSGKPYRSKWLKEKIVVECVKSTGITIQKWGNHMEYASDHTFMNKDILAINEGFESIEKMDDWFEKATNGKPTDLFLNRFKYIKQI